MRRRMNPARRRGVAAIELGFVTILFVTPLIIAIWEVGRYIHVKQIVANSAREGARLAAQGFTMKPDGTAVQIQKATGSPNVTSTVYEYLLAAGLTNIQPSDVTVTFTFTTARLTNPGAGTTPTEPYLGEKGETFTVYVSIPWNKVRWTNLGVLQPSDVHYTVTWRMLIDEAFTVNQTLPPW
jgi:Flp pilus assembly protein TadG